MFTYCALSFINVAFVNADVIKKITIMYISCCRLCLNTLYSITFNPPDDVEAKRQFHIKQSK